MTSTATSNHLNNFHLLRHLAALMVLYSHCSSVFGVPDIVFRASNGRLELSSFGVNIFFIISGYLVTQSRIATPGRLQFGKKRLLRLWPALAVITLLLGLIIGPILSTLSAKQYFIRHETWHFLWRNLVFLPVYYLPGVFHGNPVNSPFWTLFFEMVCYGILFLMPIKWLKAYRHWFLAVLLGMVFVKFTSIELPFPVWLKPYQYGISNMMVLFAAGSIYRLFEDEIPTTKGFMISMLLVLLATIIFSFPKNISHVLQAIALVFSVIGFGKSTAVINWPSWDISYGLYLWAFPVQQFVVFHMPLVNGSSALVLGVTLLLTIPLAALSWWYVEKPGLQLKKQKIWKLNFR